jgi:hypothetical protein
MMNHSTLSKAQLLSLREDQQIVIFDYYRLVSNSISDPPHIDDVIQFWKIAEADPDIATWLEFIDFFFIPSPADAPILSEDSRSHLSEYILLLALQRHPEEANLNNLLDTPSSLIAVCPDGTGFLKLSQESLSSNDWSQFMAEPCPRCDRPFSEHDVTFSNHAKDGIQQST